jgi:hypothetical protein
MDDITVQWFALATSLVSAVAAVLAFAQSGWRSTVRATTFVLGAGSVAYLVLLPEWAPTNSPPAANSPAAVQAGPEIGPPRPQSAAPVAGRVAASIAVAGTRLARNQRRREEYLPTADGHADATPVPCIPTAHPTATFGAPLASSPVLSLLNLAGTPTPLPARYPSVYLPAEVAECPHCRTPYSASGGTLGVKCPTCSQIVDLVPAGRYFTIHCCCGNWIQSPFRYPDTGISSNEIPYFCPRCRAQGTIVHATGQN